MTVTLISGGTVVSAVGRRLADVLIDGEKIAAILAPGQVAAMGVNPDRTIDATDKYVVPGGVDVHTHMQLPFGGTEASDTFETGTRAAAWGGDDDRRLRRAEDGRECPGNAGRVA